MESRDALYAPFLIACIVALFPEGSSFLLRYQQGALLIRDIEPYNNHISHMEAAWLALCTTWLELARSIGDFAFEPNRFDLF